MKLSDQGAQFIANFEGFRATPYWDVDHYSIGHGTRSKGQSDKVTRPEALKRLHSQVESHYGKAVNDLNRKHNLELNQNQFDALTSFTYNLGPGSIGPDTGIGKALRKKDFKRAADEMLEWNKSGGRVLPGLDARRKKERSLFLRRPPVDYSEDEKKHLKRIKYQGKQPDARAWLERQKIRIKTAAIKDGSKKKPDWKKHDRGRRYQGISRALRKYK